jgi:hypothetical protein
MLSSTCRKQARTSGMSSKYPRLAPLIPSSRTPSRSPHRSNTDSLLNSSTSTQPPSSRPAEPTIREETSASVSKTLSARQAQPVPPPPAQHASRATPPSTSSNGATRSKSKYRMVGDWQLQKTLGAGSMGKVKLGVNMHTREKVRWQSISKY